MFNLVSKTQFDAEHELRLKAEAREAAKQVLVDDLRTQNGALLEALRAKDALDQEYRLKGQTDLLDRLAPKPTTIGIGDGSEFRHMSAAEIRARPAVGKRQMELRERDARAAEAREQSASKGTGPAPTAEAAAQFASPPPKEVGLTSDEAAEIDDMVTGRINPETPAVN